MGTTPVFEAAYKSSTYIDSEGNTKGRYTKIGTVFQDDEGRMSMILDAVPVGAQAPVWISFFPKDRSR